MPTNNAGNQSSTGIQSLTSAGVFNGDTITGTANQVSVTNGDGTGGNPTLALTSNIYVGGISFDAGTDILSAYATGTFSPTLTASSSNPTNTYSIQVGLYEKIGTKVTINVHLNLSATSGGSGNVQLDSLPYTSLNSTNAVSTLTIKLSSVTFGSSVLYYTGTVSVNSTFSIVEGIVSGSAIADLQVTGLISNSQFVYSGAYNV